ncbi:MAG: hypothetical protein MI921_21465, partial [Cytophagales bacterium]|nr:hypothetical protein [Cytophagales bacterium]
MIKCHRNRYAVLAEQQVTQRKNNKDTTIPQINQEHKNIHTKHKYEIGPGEICQPIKHEQKIKRNQKKLWNPENPELRESRPTSYDGPPFNLENNKQISNLNEADKQLLWKLNEWLINPMPINYP